jgi:hypothetical protein
VALETFGAGRGRRVPAVAERAADRGETLGLVGRRLRQVDLAQLILHL